MCIVDTHLTADEHGCLLLTAALAPLVVTHIDAQRIEWSLAASRTFGSHVDRPLLVEHACRSILARTPLMFHVAIFI